MRRDAEIGLVQPLCSRHTVRDHLSANLFEGLDLLLQLGHRVTSQFSHRSNPRKSLGGSALLHRVTSQYVRNSDGLFFLPFTIDTPSLWALSFGLVLTFFFVL